MTTLSRESKNVPPAAKEKGIMIEASGFQGSHLLKRTEKTITVVKVQWNAR